MIHLALSIASAIFLAWFAVVCIGILQVFWKPLLGGALILAGLIWLAVVWPKSSQGPALPAADTQTSVLPAAGGATGETLAERSTLSDSVKPIRASVDGLDAELKETSPGYRTWVSAVETNMPPMPADARTAFLASLYYEAKRAGLEPDLVLGLVQVASGFRKYAISSSGARGYLQVATRWAGDIGDGDASRLFHIQSNLRFGCVVLRSYIDKHGGDLREALADYYVQAGGKFAAQGGDVGAEEFIDAVFRARATWASAHRRGAKQSPRREAAKASDAATDSITESTPAAASSSH